MFILGHLIGAMAHVLNIILTLYMYVIIARAILSWVSPDPYNPIVRFINNVTDPLLHQIQKRLPLVHGGIDFSPIVVILVIIFLQQFLIASLIGLSHRLL